MTEPPPGLARCLVVVAAAAVVLLTGCASSAPVETRPEPIRTADASIGKGVDHYTRSEYARAAAAFEQALYGYRSVDDPEGTAASCINLAKTRLAQGDREAAGRWLDAALHVIDSNGLQQLQPRVTIIRSSIAIESGRLDTARAMLEPILDAAPESVEKDTLRAALQNRVRIAFALERDRAAWTERYAQHVGVDSPLHRARLARFRAALADDAVDADRYYSDALELYREFAHRPGIAATLYEWSGAWMQRGDDEAAADRLARALFIRASMQDAASAASILERMAELYRLSGNERALDATREWIERVKADGFSDWRSLTQSYGMFPLQ